MSDSVTWLDQRSPRPANPVALTPIYSGVLASVEYVVPFPGSIQTVLGLGAGASPSDNAYSGELLFLTSRGTNYRIVTYVGATKKATLADGIDAVASPGDPFTISEDFAQPAKCWTDPGDND